MPKALVIGTVGNEGHEASVRDAFVKGYNDSAAEFGDAQITAADVVITSMNSLDYQYGFDWCKANNIPIMICSYSGALSQIATAQANYPEVTLFMPTGRNEPGEIFDGEIPQVICLTGAGDIANETADNVEFIAPDPIASDEQDYSSFANGYIAGQIAFIKDKLNCSTWEARYRAAMTGSEGGKWDERNGFGFINVKNAVDFSGNIADDPFLLKSYLTSVAEIRSEGNLSADISDDQIEPHLKKASAELRRMLDNLYPIIAREINTQRRRDCSLAEANLALSYAIVPLNIESSGSGIMQSKGFGETKNELIDYQTAESLSDYFRSVAMRFLSPYLPQVESDGTSSGNYLIGAL